MTYNTLFAGFDGIVGNRRQVQLDIIKQQNPDLLLLQEAKGFQAAGGNLLFETERVLGMRGFLAEAPVTGQHTAIFIKPQISPMSFETDTAHFHHAASILRFTVSGSPQPFTAINVHLCPNGPDVRKREVSYLANYADPASRVIICGDFNSISPDDDEPKGLETLPARYRMRYVNETGRADRSTLTFLKSAGFIDIGAVLNDKTPTVPGAGFKNTEFVPFRSDYVLATTVLREAATHYEVIRNPASDIASDHYPIIVQFDC